MRSKANNSQSGWAGGGARLTSRFNSLRRGQRKEGHSETKQHHQRNTQGQKTRGGDSENQEKGDEKKREKRGGQNNK